MSGSDPIDAQLLVRKLNKNQKLWRKAKSSKLITFLTYCIILFGGLSIYIVTKNERSIIFFILGAVAITYYALSVRINALVELLEDIKESKGDK